MSHGNLNNFFEDLLHSVNCQPETKAYLVSLYCDYKYTHYDLSKESLTLLFVQAKNKQDFLKFQNIGNWIFFIHTLMPKHLHHASKEYYDTLARLSYYSCYRLINRQWLLFEELADRFNEIEEEVQNVFTTLQNTDTLLLR